MLNSGNGTDSYSTIQNSFTCSPLTANKQINIVQLCSKKENKDKPPPQIGLMNNLPVYIT